MGSCLTLLGLRAAAAMTRQSLAFAVIGSLTLPDGVFSFLAPLRVRASLVENGRARKARCRMEVMEVELEQAMDNITAKRLDLVDKGQGIYNYEFTIEASGSSTQRLNHHITRAVREKSNFPNLKRGQVPPHLVLETKRFVVEEVMNEGISTALEAHGLEGADGEGTNADILTDINELSMNFKPGRTLTFTCMIRAKERPPDAQEEVSATESDSGGSVATSADTRAPASEGEVALPDITASVVDDGSLAENTA